MHPVSSLAAGWRKSTFDKKFSFRSTLVDNRWSMGGGSSPWHPLHPSTGKVERSLRVMTLHSRLSTENHSRSPVPTVFHVVTAVSAFCSPYVFALYVSRLGAFCSHYGADFYGIPRNEGMVKMVKQTWKVPASYTFGQTVVVPLRAGEEVGWQMVGEGKRPRTAP